LATSILVDGVEVQMRYLGDIMRKS